MQTIIMRIALRGYLYMDSRVVRCNHLIKKIQKGDEKALDALFQEFGLLFLNKEE